MAKNTEGNTSGEEALNLPQNLGQVDPTEDVRSTNQTTPDPALAPRDVSGPI